MARAVNTTSLVSSMTSNATHNTNVAAADAVRTNTIQTAASASPVGIAPSHVVRAADAQEYFSVVTSALANSISQSTIYEHLQALRELGLTPDKLPQGYGQPGYVSKGWPV